MNEFDGLFFAFNNDQLKEGLRKVGLKEDETNEIVSIGMGGYLRKDKEEAFNNMLDRFDQERKDLRNNQKKLFNALVYELRNHEYCITYDIEPALNELGLELKDIPKEMLRRACKKAL